MLLCEKHLHDPIISIRGEGWIYKTSLTPPLFIEVPVPSQESERSCICLLIILTMPLFTILIHVLDLGIVPTVSYFFFFFILLDNIPFFTHYRFHYKFMCFHMSYFPYKRKGQIIWVQLNLSYVTFQENSEIWPHKADVRLIHV